MQIRVPLRISFVGGGTDIPPFFIDHGGYTLSTTIDRYAIISENGRDVPELENYKDLKDAALALVAQECPYMYQKVKALKIACDIPPGSGLGTSSAIAVGLCLYIYPNASPDFIAKKAIELERVYAGILGGIQDQYNAAFPGLNRFRFHGELISQSKKNTDLSNIELITEVIPYHKLAVDKDELNKRLLLVDTGIIRRQVNIMSEQIKRTTDKENTNLLTIIKNHVGNAHAALTQCDYRYLGTTLLASWELKRRLSTGISIEIVQEILELALKERIAYGGKLLGAGGGGYVLLICENREHAYYTLTAKGYRCIKPNITEDYIIE